MTDTTNGFAWPDTELGVIETPQGYTFFGSDGAQHARQYREDHYEGNNKFGSVTRTLGTLDNPLGTEPPIDVTINPNPDPAVNPFYASYDYISGGPVYRVPKGKPGEGKLLMVYHAEIPTIATQSFDSVLALAASKNDGESWTDLGEIIRLNQGYRADMDGFDIGDPNSSRPQTANVLHLFHRLAGQWNHPLGHHHQLHHRGPRPDRTSPIGGLQS